MAEMTVLASLMRRAALAGVAPEWVRNDGAALAGRFPVLRYRFDTEPAFPVGGSGRRTD